VLEAMMKYRPNSECVNFQAEAETTVTRCPMCAWNLVLVKRADIIRDRTSNSEAA
jgi:hypothetical protein